MENTFQIGDIFCVNLATGINRYFQYICDDKSIYSTTPVIRAFQYKCESSYSPSISDIIKSKIDFYAHAGIYDGLFFNKWHVVGNSSDLGLNKAAKILFIRSIFIGTWGVWHINSPGVSLHVDIPEELKQPFEWGDIFGYIPIIDRLETGSYKCILHRT